MKRTDALTTAATPRHVPAPAGGFRGWLAAWAQAWNEFWFTPSDPLPLAVVRIATGLILTWSCLVWLLDADAFFGPRGWLAPGDAWRWGRAAHGFHSTRPCSAAGRGRAGGLPPRGPPWPCD
jgi:hypothetical protein